jgi:hypothetical protein
MTLREKTRINEDIKYEVTLLQTVGWSIARSVGQSVSMSWLGHLPRPGPDFSFSFILPENCFALRLGAPTLMRERVCNS